MENGVEEKASSRFYDGKFHFYPALMFKKGDRYNSKRFGISWLWFTVMDAMTPWPGIEIGIGGFRISFLYVNFFFSIANSRLVWKLSSWSHKNLWRVGEKSKYKWLR